MIRLGGNLTVGIEFMIKMILWSGASCSSSSGEVDKPYSFNGTPSFGLFPNLALERFSENCSRNGGRAALLRGFGGAATPPCQLGQYGYDKT